MAIHALPISARHASLYLGFLAVYLVLNVILIYNSGLLFA